MENICKNCEFAKPWSAQNVGPNEVPKHFIKCLNEKASLSVHQVQPDFGCIHFKEKGQ